ncbi:MAG: hypothetical protein RL033_2830 [Pseudomonadota bacterium]
MSARPARHPAEKLAAWGSLVPLALLFLAPWLSQYTSLWYALCCACSMLVLSCIWRLASAISSPLHTAANLVTALREGNYSLRARPGSEGGAAELLLGEVNALAAELRKDRLGETEASELLAKVMSEIDTAVLAVDAEGRVVLENPAAAALFGQQPGALTGQSTAAFGLGIGADTTLPVLPVRGTTRFPGDLPGALGPFEIAVQPFRYRGREHTLLVLTSLARLLRDEERRAQRRIISVLSHEINNSLAPIKSLAGRLQSLAQQLQPAPAEDKAEAFEHLQTGLSVIERRSEHLGRVMSDYARLARTAAPSFRPLVVRDWVARNARLWPQIVLGEGGADEVLLAGDEALLDQVLLNLVKNALEATESQCDVASSAAAEPVTLSWHSSERWLTLVIADRGPGLRGDIDPFLPFVTSKPQGSGIGLALCREIADAHGGRLELVNRGDGPGCWARLTLPLQQA